MIPAERTCNLMVSAVQVQYGSQTARRHGEPVEESDCQSTSMSLEPGSSTRDDEGNAEDRRYQNIQDDDLHFSTGFFL